jgi:hypothetical protein
LAVAEWHCTVPFCAKGVFVFQVLLEGAVRIVPRPEVVHRQLALDQTLDEKQDTVGNRLEVTP